MVVPLFYDFEICIWLSQEVDAEGSNFHNATLRE